MAAVTNFDEMKRLHDWARTGGPGGKAWIEFATAMFDSFPALYEIAKAMNADGKRLRKGLEAVEQLIGDSTGVVGLHMNGDLAPWDELRTGGRYEEWLADFDAALERPNVLADRREPIGEASSPKGDGRAAG